MFATFRRFRRQTAVLAVLSLLASVLVAVPAVAADPEPNYTAAFDACADAPSSGFTDIPANHGNAGDIDCIAYYGVTKGTGDGTTYSPNMSVTREHMALFLVRLAGLVGIDVPSAGDTGFSDTAELSANSQAAISQLRQLEITEGTSDTTYSPADSVTRGNMALFVARLMNLMTPLTDGDPSLDDTVFYGYTPSHVDDNEKVTVKNEDDEDEAPEIKAPFGDLGPVSKNQYDAITQLYELDVASGISATAYAPSALMTRAAMAGFMAAVLDHSNARPAGVSVQANKTSGFGEYVSTVMVSVRGDDFGVMSDQLVDIFQNNCLDTCDEPLHFITSGDDAGKCNGKQSVGDCTWNTDDAQTDGNGNIFHGADVGPTDTDPSGLTHTVYAWMGEDSGDEFNVNDDDYNSVDLSYTPAEDNIDVSTSIPDDAVASVRAGGQQVDLGSTKSVVVTAQLQATEDTDGDGEDETFDVAREGVEVTISWTREVWDRGDAVDGANPATDQDTSSTLYENTEEAKKATNADGTVTFVVDAPRNIKSDEFQDVVDTIEFMSDDSEDSDNADTMGMVMINWVEDDPVLTTVTSSATEYVIVDGDGDDDDDGNISVSVRLFDQYGNGIRQNAAGDAYNVEMTLPATGHETDTDPDTDGYQAGDGIVKNPSVSSSSSRRGMARALFAVNKIGEATHSLQIAFDVRQPERDSDGDLVDSVVDDVNDPDTLGVQINQQVITAFDNVNVENVTYVYTEADEKDGDDTQLDVANVFGGTDDSPATHFANAGTGDDHGVLYGMDDNDTYIQNGAVADPCEVLRPDVGDEVRVVIYDTDSDDESIFDITPTLTNN